MHGEVRTECEARSAHADAIERDFFTQAHASNSRCKQLTDLDRTLEECQILFRQQEMDLEVWEAILAKELEHGLHPTDGRDWSVELDKARTRVDRIDGERAAEAEQLL
jgi:hypothetical protein